MKLSKVLAAVVATSLVSAPVAAQAAQANIEQSRVGTDVDGEFVGTVELTHKLADSDTVRDCVTVQWFRFAFGRGESTRDECTIDALRTAFAESDHDVRELMIAIATGDAFRNMRIQ